MVLTQILGISVSSALALALFLHIGTMAVVLVVFRHLFFRYLLSLQVLVKPSDNIAQEMKSDFYGVTLIITVTIGTAITSVISLFFLEEILISLSTALGFSFSELLMLLIGVFLIITGLILKYQQLSVRGQMLLQWFYLMKVRIIRKRQLLFLR